MTESCDRKQPQSIDPRKGYKHDYSMIYRHVTR